MAAVRSRLRELLCEWPEHPLLEQLETICTRILALPANGPLKAALTGVELLLSRAQTWEDGASSQVSLAPLLAACAQLAQRWRAADLAAWPRALVSCTRRAASAADSTWFALFRLLTAAPDAAAEHPAWLRGVAAALEEFLRAAPLGEFERRLALLWAFHAHARLDAACGAPAANHLAPLLFNTHRYYAQFARSVRAALAAAGAPIQSKLKEHLKLAKWEVRCPPPHPPSLPLPISPYGRGPMPPSSSQGHANICASDWVGVATSKPWACAQYCRKIHPSLRCSTPC